MYNNHDVLKVPDAFLSIQNILFQYGIPIPVIERTSGKNFILNGIPFTSERLDDILPHLITLHSADVLVKENIPEELQHLFADKVMNLRILQRVLQDLLTEGVSVRNIRPVLESCLDFVNGPSNYELLYEHTRKAMKEQIAGTYTVEDTIHAVYFASSTTEGWKTKAPGPEFFDKLMDAFVPYKLSPVAVVEDTKIRHELSRMYPGLHWMSLDEIPMTTRVFVMEDFRFPDIDGGASEKSQESGKLP